jgi:hypothetical protein
MATATQRAEEADTSGGVGEVSLGQKMMSAVSGSVLTSLLGKSTTKPSSADCAPGYSRCKKVGYKTVETFAKEKHVSSS